jgi:hypothetical protein
LIDPRELPGFALLVNPDLEILAASPMAEAFLKGRTLPEASDPSSVEKLGQAIEKARSGRSLNGWEITLYDDAEDHVFLFDIGPAGSGVYLTGCDVSALAHAASAAGTAAITLDDAYERARRLIAELTERDEEARQALVTALHDDAIQPLVAAQMRLGETAPEIAEQLGASIDRLRRIVEATRPFPLAEGRLWPAVRDLARRYDASVEDPSVEEPGEPDASVIYRAVERFLEHSSPGALIRPTRSGFDIDSLDDESLPRRFLSRERAIMAALGGSIVEMPGRWQVRLRRLSSPGDRARPDTAADPGSGVSS